MENFAVRYVTKVAAKHALTYCRSTFRGASTHDTMDSEERIRALEERVSSLERALRSPSQAVRSVSVPKASKARVDTSRAMGRTVLEFLTGEGALARVGIALLLGGLLFLVKYGIDHGWINEVVRVALAAIAGGILLALGHRMAKSRILSQVLIGGGVGALYVAVFSAHVFYGLIPMGVAIGLASVVSLVCLGMSLTSDSPILAGVALSAALGTPFVLSSGEGSVPALTVYLILVFLTAAYVFLQRRWSLIHAFTGFLGFAVLFLATQMLSESATITDRAVVQAGILVLWLVFAVLPLVPSGFEKAGPSALSPMDRIGSAIQDLVSGMLPLLIWVLTYAAWSLERIDAGLVALFFGAAYAVVLTVGQERSDVQASRGILLSATATLLAISALVLTDADGFGLLAVLAVLLLVLAAKLDWTESRPIAFILTVIAATGLALRLFAIDNPAFSDSIYDGLGVLGLLATGWLSKDRRPTLAAGWLLSLVFLERELSAIGEATGVGPGLATAAWALTAIGLLALGFQTREIAFRYAGMVTVGLIVAKLILFDMSRLDPVWRILVFLGIGVALLATSYFFPSVWDREEQAD